MIQDYFLSQIWNGTQFFDADGNPLAGGKIGTYLAGSMSVQSPTYADNNGDVENTNPIVLDSSGRIPTDMWCTLNDNYQFVLYQPDGVTVIMAVDNVGTHDPFPDQTGADGLFLGSDGDVVGWERVLPNQAGQNGKVLSTNGASPTGNLSWVAQSGGGGGAGPQEFITKLASTSTRVSDGFVNVYWYSTVYQESTECTATDFYGGNPIEFLVTTAGIYKVTITARVEATDYPYGSLPNEPTMYGTRCSGTIGGFATSCHQSGEADMWYWQSNQTDQCMFQWTDTYYVENYFGDATFYVGLFVNNVGQALNFNSYALVSVVRTSGDVWPEIPA